MKHNVLNILLVSCFVLIGLNTKSLQAQALDFKSYTVSDGLPHGQISDLAQTSNGIMWLGTVASGLVRFDGQTYKTYGITKGLKDDMIINVYADSKDRLWVSTYTGGVSTLVGDSLINPFQNPAFDTLFVSSILESPNGDIWFGTYGEGIFVYDGNELNPYVENYRLNSSVVWDVFWDDNEEIWIATNNGITVLDGISTRYYTNEKEISGERVFSIAEDNNRTKWMATSRGVTKFDGENFEQITEINGTQLNYVFDLIIDSRNKVWIGMENIGLFWYENNQFTHITRHEGLVSNYTHKLFEDRNGNVWVATDENGISIYKGDGFKFYRSTAGLNSNEILGFHKDKKGVIWIGTANGLQSFDGNKFENHDIGLMGEPNKQVWVINEFKNGNLLILLDNSVLLEYDGRTYTNYSEKIGVSQYYIVDTHFDQEGNLWIGTDEGLLKYDGDSLHYYDSSKGLAGSIVNHIFESNSNEIWIATSLGVSKYGDGTFENIGLEDGLAHYNVNYIAQDSKGDLWFGTSAGVSYYHVDKTTGEPTIHNFGKEDGMKLVETLFLYFDSNDQLWQGTNGGIHRLNAARFRENGTMNIEHYRLSRMGLGIETNHDAVIKIDSTRIWFGTMEGIVEMDINEFRKRSVASPVTMIENVLFNGIPADINIQNTDPYFNGILDVGQTEFDYGNNNLTFIFKGIEYVTPENLTYRYRLIGFDDNWITTSINNFANYTNLPAGEYQFDVQSKVGSDPWSINIASVPFTIKTPYYQTSWFWILMALFLIGAMTGIIQLRLYFLERVKLAQLVNEKTSHLSKALQEKDVLLKEVHHRVKNNLSIIYGLLELQMEYITDEQIKDAFRDSQLRVHSIAMVHEKLYQSDNLSRIDAKKYISELVGVISDSMMEEGKIVDISIDVDDIQLTLDQGIPSGLILNELISNSFKHAFSDIEHAKLLVSLKKEDNMTVMSVEDNGNGLPEDYQIGNSESLGHILIEALTRQLKSKIEILSEPGRTQFQIRFVAE